MPTRIARLALLLPALLAGACTTGPDYEPPDPVLPDAFDAAPGEPAPAATDAWWECLGDPVLQACVEEALVANLDARASLQRIRAARALRRMDSADYWPQIGARASYTYDRISANNPRFEQAIEGGLFPRDVEYWELGFDVTWELDVFGGTERRVEAGAARIQEQECERGALLLSVAAEVARNYLEIVGNQQRLKLVAHQLANEEARLALIEQRRASGILPADRVLQTRAGIQQLQAVVPRLEAEVRAGKYRLAVLLGRRPEESMPELDAARELPIAAGQVPVGLPSELLRRRPDVAAAERRLAAATADIGVATADLFPRFFLTGSPYLQSKNFSDLFSSPSSGWLFGPSLSWNPFAGGRNKARIESTRAQAEAAMLEYEATVNRVLEEVESSLVRYGNDAESLRSLVAADESQAQLTRIQAARYEGGITDKQNFLTASNTGLETQLLRLDQEVLLLTRWVALHKALGGGWAEAEALSVAAAQRQMEEQAEEQGS